MAAAEAAASAALPAGSWADVRTEQPAVWIVYMGKFASADAQQKKVEELTRREVAFEPVSGAPELEPGLALGRFDERAQADAALQKLAQQHAIRTARVVELRHATVQHRLRIAQADPSLAGRATALQAEALGRGFVPCGKE